MNDTMTTALAVAYHRYQIDLAICGPYAFSFVHVDYDGPPDNRCGYGNSIEECKAEIDEIELQREERLNEKRAAQVCDDREC